MSPTISRRRFAPPWQRFLSSLRRVAFWASVLLPVVYLPLLSTRVRTAVVGSSGVDAVLGLVLVNVICLLVGHGYQP